MCRVCLKRPDIPDERYGRCEQCAKAGRIAFRLRLGPGRGTVFAVKAGELSPRALRERWRAKLLAFGGRPQVRQHLGLHELELITAKDRLESIRVAPDLAGHDDEVMAALRAAADRSDASW
ncbi:MAG: hypothetical protein JOY80_06120 [Candidatus Dormibacteraeota bacterium]|nr:hypothetical protein [Candidatus Dormibacteraeota bacterium]